MEQGLTVTELRTQDGYDWPSGCTDERWPAPSVAEQLLARCIDETLESMRRADRDREYDAAAHAAAYPGF